MSSSNNHQRRNEGTSPDQGQQFGWNDQARDARLNAIVAPDCDWNRMECRSSWSASPSMKGSFSADGRREVVVDRVGERPLWTGYSDAITDSRLVALVDGRWRMPMDPSGVAGGTGTRAIGAQEPREYDIDSLLLSGGGGGRPAQLTSCMDIDYEVDEDDDEDVGGGRTDWVDNQSDAGINLHSL